MSNHIPSRRRHSKTPVESGFSLIEVLIALTILGLVLGSLFEIFSGGLRNVAAAEQYVRAAAIADSKLASVGQEILLEPGNESDGMQGEYAWAVSITPYQAGDDATRIENAAAQLYQVTVSVRWAHVLGQRKVTIDTLMNGSKP